MPGKARTGDGGCRDQASGYQPVRDSLGVVWAKVAIVEGCTLHLSCGRAAMFLASGPPSLISRVDPSFVCLTRPGGKVRDSMYARRSRQGLFCASEHGTRVSSGIRLIKAGRSGCVPWKSGYSREVAANCGSDKVPVIWNCSVGYRAKRIGFGSPAPPACMQQPSAVHSNGRTSHLQLLLQSHC
jgi:hypothetical protein